MTDTNYAHYPFSSKERRIDFDLKLRALFNEYDDIVGTLSREVDCECEHHIVADPNVPVWVDQWVVVANVRNVDGVGETLTIRPLGQAPFEALGLLQIAMEGV